MKNKKIFFKFFLLMMFFLATVFQDALAAGELTETNTTRLSPFAYDMDNSWKGSRRPINADNTKILLNERIDGAGVANWVHPRWSSTIGRGVVVGNIAALKAACTDNNCMNNPTQEQQNQWLIDYLAATKPLNNSFLTRQCMLTYAGREVGCINRFSSQEVQWSQIPGEENIVYGLYDKDNGVAIRELVRINVDTGATTKVGNYPAGMSVPMLWGWKQPNSVIIDADSDDSGNGYTMNVSTGAYSYYSSLPMRGSPTEASTWLYGNMHFAYSPNGQLEAHYSGRPSANGVLNNDCTYNHPNPLGYYPNCQTPYADPIHYSSYGGDVPSDWIDSDEGNFSHVNWIYSNDWFLAGSSGIPFKANEGKPYITTYKIDQVFFNRDVGTFIHRNLISYDGAGVWIEAGGNDVNYYGLPSPAMSNNGAMIVFANSNGKYTPIDKRKCDAGLVAAICSEVALNWETMGMFLADLAPAAGSDTTPPAPPSGVSVQ